VAPTFLKIFKLVEQIACGLTGQSGVVAIGPSSALLAVAGRTSPCSFCHVVFECLALRLNRGRGQQAHAKQYLPCCHENEDKSSGEWPMAFKKHAEI
jgi:hypothetical protein